MRFILKLLIVSTVFLMFSSCKKDEDTSTAVVNKIMPLGASRVAGFAPTFYSYRYELWKDLVENDWNVDFVGRNTEPNSYPEVNGQVFDADHQGTASHVSSEVLTALETSLAQDIIPDIVLLSSPGGNDALQGLPYPDALANVYSMVDALQAKNPNVTIIIEEMAPGTVEFMTDDFLALMAQLKIDLATLQTAKTTANSKIVLVDMADGFDSTTMLADFIHYNESGAEFIASKYYEALEGVMKK